MTAMTPEKLRELEPPDRGFVMEWKQQRDALASAWEADQKRADGWQRQAEDLAAGIALAINRQHDAETHIEALWKHCRIIYYPPATEATGWAQPYPIEHNMVAGKNGRDAIEAAIAAEEKP
jgi:hypothetical protein